MTERLYYRDSYLWKFAAQVAQIRELVGKYQIALNQSAFYPSSGGQLFDTGYLAGERVVETIEADGEVWHILEKRPVFNIGDEIVGEIDAERRLINMRKHTGQHILSQALVRTAGAETVSSHLGEEDCTVDVKGAHFSREQIEAAELLANKVVLENRSLTIDFVPPEGLQNYPLRKTPKRKADEYRIIAIADFDCTACGGTHCEATGTVGLIKINGTEKMHGNLRLHFLTGLAALEDYCQRFNQTEILSGMFTCHSQEIVRAVQDLQEENSCRRRDLLESRKRLLPYLSERLYGDGHERDGIRIVTIHFDSNDAGEKRDIALSIIKSYPAVVVAGGQDKLLVAVSEQLSLSADELLKRLIVRLGGRGGGSSQLAQGGGFKEEDIKVLLADPGRILDK